MKTIKKLLSFVLCLSLCMSLTVPAMAANENNDRGVTFSVSLDQTSVAASTVDQVVTMTLSASTSVSLDGSAFYVTCPEPLKLTAANENIDNFMFDPDVTNLEDFYVAGCLESGYDSVTGITELAVITLTVPADTQPGTYEVGVTDIELTDNVGDTWETAASATTTLTVTAAGGNEDDDDQPEITGYSAGISTTTPAVTVGEKIYVTVAVNHKEEATFNAGELVIAYDTGCLTFDQAGSTLGDATVKATTGILTLEDYGAKKNCGNGIYTLAFEATAAGVVDMTMRRAAFSNLENAASSDLIEAVTNPETVRISIGKKSFSVSLPEGMDGAEFVTEGESYTFYISDENYTYSNIIATVDGASVAVIDNGDGTYTISDVSGDLEITATRTPKSYTVTFVGTAADDISDGAATATYGTDYKFTIPVVNGWVYSLGGITIGGNNYTGYTRTESEYTIPGTAITGDIAITVNKEQVATSVTVTGSGAGAAEGYKTSADIGQPYTLTIKPETGYSYSVTATMGGESVELAQDGNNYTIANVTGDIIFKVDHTVVVSGVTATPYVSVDGDKVWLVQNAITFPEGKVSTYDGSNMFWSDAYNSYCYLVITPTLSNEAAKAAIGIADGTAAEVDYGMDVNMTGNVDANDAQLAYNIYNAYYDAFDTTVTMEKFLRADVTKNGLVDTADGAAIINKILNG